jgi:HD-GYP domain-containing protein (c-di-GMP phosphodiesterase class II)
MKNKKESALSLTQQEITELLKTTPSGIKKYIDELEGQIKNLSEIGVALSKEKDRGKILETILLEAKRISSADGGTIYMKTDDNRLKFEIMMTDSLGIHFGGTSAEPMPDTIYPVKLYNPETNQPNYKNVSAYAALTGETVNIKDAYKEKGFDFSGTKGWDKRHGYRSKSFLTVPMKNHEDNIIGVLQLLNTKNPSTGEIASFSTSIKMIESLASQAAIVITNKNLIRELEVLFESFIKLIATAIDKKSAYTGGHCSRVPEITMMLADAVGKIKSGKYKDFDMNPDERNELYIAAWLHDCGKVATPTHIVDKATKLEKIFDRIDIINMKFEVLRRDKEIEFLKKIYKLKNSDKTVLEKLKGEYKRQMKQLDEDEAFLERCNIGGEFMLEELQERVIQIAKYPFKEKGKKKPFLSKDEVRNLNISKGTLLPEEREIINSHISITIDMLEQLPYPKHLKNIPEFAGGHHEKLDGTGYPRGLTENQMSPQAKMIAIADIYEALTAADRPYKEGKKLSEAMRIMGFMNKDRHIDKDLFKIFVKEGIYKKYAKKFLKPNQIDKVDETVIL